MAIDARVRVPAYFQRSAIHHGLDVRQNIFIGLDGHALAAALFDFDHPGHAECDPGKSGHVAGFNFRLAR